MLWKRFLDLRSCTLFLSSFHYLENCTCNHIPPLEDSPENILVFRFNKIIHVLCFTNIEKLEELPSFTIFFNISNNNIMIHSSRITLDCFPRVIFKNKPQLRTS